MTPPRQFRVPKTVVLIGMMGAGKTCIGRKLAERLGIPFIDADAEIAEAAGCSISDIFAIHGEQAFREGERRVIARVLEGPAHELATGGGAFLVSSAAKRIKPVMTSPPASAAASITVLPSFPVWPAGGRAAPG